MDIDPPAPITSHGNELARRARLLAQRKAREEQGAVFVEGIRPVWQALDQRVDIEVILTAPDLLTSDAATAALRDAQAMGIRVAEFSAPVFSRFCGRDHPSGLAAIVHAAPALIETLRPNPRSLYVALYEIGNPGNLGAILRTMDAVGGSGLVVIGDATDPYHPTAVKASMGTIFSVPIVRCDRAAAVFAWAKSRGVAVIGTSERAERTHWEAPLPAPCLLLLGSEGRGLPPELLDACDHAVRIPMQGTAGSLNLAAAASILLYEARRPRQ
jgi:RNA methyltransferase, TrmH family